jgi:hypothetical protein
VAAPQPITASGGIVAGSVVMSTTTVSASREAVAAGQLYVEHDQIGAQLLAELERRLAVRRVTDVFKAVELADELAQRGAQPGMIIDDLYPRRRTAGRRR